MQLIIAGKAHPADLAGQVLIREWTQFIRNSEGSPPVVFLADYEMLLAEHLVQGIDAWLNTPRRPWEACGTSGMKVLVNGGLNLSKMDGWWAEAYRPDVGWALGDGQEHGDDPEWDAAEADALYERVEQEVIPEFYARDAHNRPVAWLTRIRESMARLTCYARPASTTRCSMKRPVQISLATHTKCPSDPEESEHVCGRIGVPASGKQRSQIAHSVAGGHEWRLCSPIRQRLTVADRCHQPVAEAAPTDGIG